MTAEQFYTVNANRERNLTTVYGISEVEHGPVTSKFNGTMFTVGTRTTQKIQTT